MPPWETGSTTTANGNEDGLRILLSRAAAFKGAAMTKGSAGSCFVTVERNWERCSSGCAAKSSGVVLITSAICEEVKRGSYPVCVEF